MTLANKVALVTGAAQGIGLACAKAFAAEGARVVLADVNEERGREAATGLGAAFVRCDVSRKAEVSAAVEKAVREYGRLDVLVANAGIVHAADFLDLEEADFDRVLSVNLKGIFLAGQAAARQMVKQGGGGAIVNMSSVNAVMAIPNQVPYVVSKGGINQLTKVMALSLAKHRIRSRVYDRRFRARENENVKPGHGHYAVDSWNADARRRTAPDFSYSGSDFALLRCFLRGCVRF